MIIWLKSNKSEKDLGVGVMATVSDPQLSSCSSGNKPRDPGTLLPAPCPLPSPAATHVAVMHYLRLSSLSSRTVGTFFFYKRSTFILCWVFCSRRSFPSLGLSLHTPAIFLSIYTCRPRLHHHPRSSAPPPKKQKLGRVAPWDSESLKWSCIVALKWRQILDCKLWTRATLDEE